MVASVLFLCVESLLFDYTLFFFPFFPFIRFQIRTHLLQQKKGKCRAKWVVFVVVSVALMGMESLLVDDPVFFFFPFYSLVHKDIDLYDREKGEN